jgi:hypothetical protein
LGTKPEPGKRKDFSLQNQMTKAADALFFLFFPSSPTGPKVGKFLNPLPFFLPMAVSSRPLESFLDPNFHQMKSGAGLRSSPAGLGIAASIHPL